MREAFAMQVFFFLVMCLFMCFTALSYIKVFHFVKRIRLLSRVGKTRAAKGKLQPSASRMWLLQVFFFFLVMCFTALSNIKVFHFVKRIRLLSRVGKTRAAKGKLQPSASRMWLSHLCVVSG